MPKHRSLAVVSVLAATLASSLAMAAGAQASDASVRSAIHAAGKQIKESPELKSAVKEAKAGKGKVSPSKLESLFKKAATAYEGAAKTVEAQKASTAKGKQGEALWLTGVRKEATAFGDYAKGFEEKQQGQTSEAKKEVLDGAGILVKGAKDIDHGDELLGLK